MQGGHAVRISPGPDSPDNGPDHFQVLALTFCEKIVQFGKNIQIEDNFFETSIHRINGLKRHGNPFSTI